MKNNYRIIEELNYDFLLLVNKYDDLKNLNKTDKAKNLLKKRELQLLFQKSLKHIPIIKNYYNYKLNKINVIRNPYYFSELTKEIPNNRIVVYTCITGNYDNISLPYIKEENVDYILYTDNKNLKNNIWNVKQIPNSLKKLETHQLINRYIKLHPHELFKNKYDYAIYIDGNIKIMSTIKDLQFCINKKTGLAFHRHRTRNDVYNELVACKLIGRARATDCNKQIKNYQKMKLPKNFGLFECNAFIVDLNNKNCEKIFIDWWEDFFVEPTKRDQPSLIYSLWKNNFTSADVGVLGNDIYLNPKFRIGNHK